MMHIPCVNFNRFIHHSWNKKRIHGWWNMWNSLYNCFRRRKRLLGNSSKVKCQFINNEDEQEKSNFERFAEEAQEALNPLSLQLDGHRVCKNLLEHDEICRKWEDLLPVIQSKYSGEWVEEQLQAVTKRIYDKDNLYLSLCHHFIFSEWLMSDISILIL